MKKLLVLFICLSISYIAWAQVSESDYYATNGYEYACKGGPSYIYVNSKIRKTDGYYYVWVKDVIRKDIHKERERLAKLYENNKYLFYKYSVKLLAVDLRGYRVKYIDNTDYDDNGEVINSLSWGFNEANWSHALPGSILDGICRTVEDMVKN